MAAFIFSAITDYIVESLQEIFKEKSVVAFCIGFCSGLLSLAAYFYMYHTNTPFTNHINHILNIYVLGGIQKEEHEDKKKTPKSPEDLKVANAKRQKTKTMNEALHTKHKSLADYLITFLEVITKTKSVKELKSDIQFAYERIQQFEDTYVKAISRA